MEDKMACNLCMTTNNGYKVSNEWFNRKYLDLIGIGIFSSKKRFLKGEMCLGGDERRINKFKLCLEKSEGTKGKGKF